MEETKSRLSTGDSFVIEIEVYLTNSSFAKNLDATENPIDLKKSNFDYSKESESEAALRLRQFAISNLFDRLAIKPLKVNDDTEDEEDISSQEINSGDVEHPVPEINLDQMKEFYQSNNQLKILEGLPETTTPPKENFALDLEVTKSMVCRGCLHVKRIGCFGNASE